MRVGKSKQIGFRLSSPSRQRSGRLARQGYYRGETDGVLSAEMQNAIRRYQSTNGLRQTGDLDSDTLTVMGLSQGTSY